MFYNNIKILSNNYNNISTIVDVMNSKLSILLEASLVINTSIKANNHKLIIYSAPEQGSILSTIYFNTETKKSGELVPDSPIIIDNVTGILPVEFQYETSDGNIEVIKDELRVSDLFQFSSYRNLTNDKKKKPVKPILTPEVQLQCYCGAKLTLLLHRYIEKKPSNKSSRVSSAVEQRNSLSGSKGADTEVTKMDSSSNDDVTNNVHVTFNTAANKIKYITPRKLPNTTEELSDTETLLNSSIDSSDNTKSPSPVQAQQVHVDTQSRSSTPSDSGADSNRASRWKLYKNSHSVTLPEASFVGDNSTATTTNRSAASVVAAPISAENCIEYVPTNNNVTHQNKAREFTGSVTDNVQLSRTTALATQQDTFEPTKRTYYFIKSLLRSAATTLPIVDIVSGGVYTVCSFVLEGSRLTYKVAMDLSSDYLSLLDLAILYCCENGDVAIQNTFTDLIESVYRLYLNLEAQCAQTTGATKDIIVNIITHLKPYVAAFGHKLAYPIVPIIDSIIAITTPIITAVNPLFNPLQKRAAEVNEMLEGSVAGSYTEYLTKRTKEAVSIAQEMYIVLKQS